MLPKIKNKCFLTPELAPTFAAKDDDLIQVLGILTRILDGHGYESDSGAHGHRGYNERMMFAWIGAAIDIPFKVHKLLTTLGPKLYFLRVPKVESKSHEAYYEQMSNDDFTTKVDEIGQALSDYQSWFEMGPEMVKDDMFGSTLRKMPWNSEENQKEAYMHIIKLAIVLSYLRGASTCTPKKDIEEWWHNERNKIKPLDASYSAFTFTEEGYQCYYCDDFKTDSKSHYEGHVTMRHGRSLAYPNKAEIEKLVLKAQGKNWEI